MDYLGTFLIIQIWKDELKMTINNEKPKIYKNRLIDKEINTLNMVEDDKVRIKMMSVYCYFVKHSKDNKVNKSIAKFFSMYKRYHQDKDKNPLTIHYFKKLVYKLVDLGLLKLEKIGKVNTYHITLRVSEVVSNLVSEKKEPESIEIPNVEPVLENTQIQNPIVNTNTNTLNTIASDIVAPVEIVNVAKKFMREAKIKSAIVKDMVIEKLRDCLNINRIGMLKYIETVVKEKLDMYKQSRANINSMFAKKHYTTTKQQAKTIQFTNYPQREYTSEMYDELEKEALGLC